MTELVRMPVDGPFSLAAAAAFGFGPNTGRPFPAGDVVMRLAFVTDDLRHQAGARIRQQPGGLVAEISGTGDVAAVPRQLRRILSVDEPRLRFYLRHYCGLPDEPDDEAVRRIAEPWRPFRTWAAVLIRVSGDGDGLPWRQADGSSRGNR